MAHAVVAATHLSLLQGVPGDVVVGCGHCLETLVSPVAAGVPDGLLSEGPTSEDNRPEGRTPGWRAPIATQDVESIGRPSEEDQPQRRGPEMGPRQTQTPRHSIGCPEVYP